MGATIGKKKAEQRREAASPANSDIDWETKTIQSRAIGKLSMIVRAMRPGWQVGVGAATGSATRDGESSSTKGGSYSTAWSKSKENDYGEDNFRVGDYHHELLDYENIDCKLKYNAGVPETDLDEMCVICSMYKGDVSFMCRVCGRPFHHGCLIGRGIGLDTNSSRAMENAETEIGWSCPDCEALGELVPMETICDLMSSFDNYDADGDSVINLKNFLEYEEMKFINENRFDMPGLELDRCKEMFKDYDRDNDGLVSWWDYQMVEAVKILQRESQMKLAGYLKPKEIARLKVHFKTSDQLNTGLVTFGESEQAYRSWLRAVGLQNTAEVMRSFEKSTSTDESQKTISWERFICSKALALITSRPNTATIRPYVTSHETTAF